VWVSLSLHHLPPLQGHFPPACKTIEAKNIKKQKRQHDRYDRTQVSVSPPWGLQPCSSCFVGFLVLFFGIGWDARGETLCNKQSFCTQASYLSRLQYCHQKVALSQRNAAVFIYKMQDLSQSVVFFSKGTNYFFKKSSIS
jgi:hypothetical protein